MAYKRKKKEEISPFYIVLKWLVDIVVVIGVAIFVGLYLGSLYTMTGYSMEPALTNADKVLIDKLYYHFEEPERGDIIMFQSKSDEEQYYMKRIVALPGETVQIKNGILYIDGIVHEGDEDTEKILNAGLAEDEIILAEDEYFVLGDNFNNSEDSRFASIGNIKRSNIVGRAWLLV
ncbi:MAG: signal peptidase I, partial [Lachnospiraceae bacterium]|nr:signal peptidase I [Lachnospiraceae bacterium]